jgi:hypothetical protein
MSKLTAVILTAAICLPLGALLSGQASADRRQNTLPGDVAVRHRRLLMRNTYGGLVGYRQLFRAQDALHEALEAIEASQRDSEAVWNDTSGRVAGTREAVERAVQAIDQTATWVASGMVANESVGR